MARRPDPGQLNTAADLLWRLASEHGLSNLRLDDESGELVVDVEADRTYFDLVAFEDDIEARLGWRPTIVPSGAPGVRPGPALARRIHAA